MMVILITTWLDGKAPRRLVEFTSGYVYMAVWKMIGVWCSNNGKRPALNVGSTVQLSYGIEQNRRWKNSAGTSQLPFLMVKCVYAIVYGHQTGSSSEGGF